MRDFKCDNFGNFVLKNGDFYLCEKAEEVEQSLVIRLQMWLAEWFLDESLGIDFKGKVFKKHYSLIEIDKEFKNIISSTFGVTRIVSYSSKVIKKDDMEKLEVKFTVDTIYSESIVINRVLG